VSHDGEHLKQQPGGVAALLAGDRQGERNVQIVEWRVGDGAGGRCGTEPSSRRVQALQGAGRAVQVGLAVLPRFVPDPASTIAAW